ncbi:hypothetical protein ABW20_dc0101289 [Dactylellina cionopaga]|nr:hypothetical protein ABW20_dc0101289 [Dactylellina cionopaga]
MASYYYHIVLELHTRSESVSQTAIQTKLTPDTRDYILPPSGTDILTFEPTARPSCASDDTSGGSASADTAINPYPDHLDSRFSIVSLESIDMSSQPQPPTGVELSTGRFRGKSVSFAEPTDSPFSAIKARYVPIVSSIANIGYGVVHLYRDKTETPGLFGPDVPGEKELATKKAIYPKIDPPTDESTEVDAKIDIESTTLAILAVPAYMTPSDFLGFVGDDAREAVSHFRLIRTGDDVRKYMALIRFRRLEDAKIFARDYNGRVFNTMEVCIEAPIPRFHVSSVNIFLKKPETCHVVFVKSVQVQLSETELSKSRQLNATSPSSSASTEDPILLAQALQRNQYENEPPPPYQPSSVAIPVTPHMSTKPAPPPTASLLELPTCPVCLERMDETTGLLTTQCQHVFHCACLSKWKDGSCPVCRYTSNDRKSLSGARRPRRKLKMVKTEDEGTSDEDESDICFSCGAVDNLWVCLICGHVGCGRYDEKHAYEHYEQTQHCFAMDIETQRVWDYASDQYVHRLVQNKSDGKLVEFPSGRQDGQTEELYDKLDNVGIEYTYLLTSQLDSQRIYFEEQVFAAADKAAKASRRADDASEKLQQALVDLEDLKLKVDELSRDIVPSLEKSKMRAEKRAEKATELLRKFEKDWREEKVVNDGLLERVETVNKEREELLRENVDLKDQLRDMMFFVEGREKLKEMDEEGIEEGEVSIGDAGDGKRKRKGKGKGNARK